MNDKNYLPMAFGVLACSIVGGFIFMLLAWAVVAPKDGEQEAARVAAGAILTGIPLLIGGISSKKTCEVLEVLGLLAFLLGGLVLVLTSLAAVLKMAF